MRQLKHFILAAAFLTMLCSGIPAYGQKFWEKKPYQQWSFSDVGDILADSPWSKMEKDYYAQREVVNIRLHSALPVRQALVRRRQILRKYDDLTAADKATFDSEVKDFLECPGCAKFYIVTYRILTKDLKARHRLKDLSLEELKPYVFLINDKGERRNLALFVAPESGDRNALLYENAIFFFERFDEKGKPLLSVDNKKFYLEIGDKSPRLKSLPVKKFTFGVANLIQNGEIIF